MGAPLPGDPVQGPEACIPVAAPAIQADILPTFAAWAGRAFVLVLMLSVTFQPLEPAASRMMPAGAAIVHRTCQSSPHVASVTSDESAQSTELHFVVLAAAAECGAGGWGCVAVSWWLIPAFPAIG